jgi:lipopolysaccharide export system permease protein
VPAPTPAPVPNVVPPATTGADTAAQAVATPAVPPVVPPVGAPATAGPPPNAPPQSGVFGTSVLQLARLRVGETLGAMNSYDVEIHKKFALGVACVVFVLLGAPIALRFPRGGVGLVIGVSLFVFAAYYSFLIAGEELASRGLLPPWLSMWAANALFAAVGIPLAMRMGRGSGSARGGGFGEWMDNVRYRLRQRRRSPAPNPNG